MPAVGRPWPSDDYDDVDDVDDDDNDDVKSSEGRRSGPGSLLTKLYLAKTEISESVTIQLWLVFSMFAISTKICSIVHNLKGQFLLPGGRLPRGSFRGRHPEVGRGEMGGGRRCRHCSACKRDGECFLFLSPIFSNG